MLDIFVTTLQYIIMWVFFGVLFAGVGQLLDDHKWTFKGVIIGALLGPFAATLMVIVFIDKYPDFTIWERKKK